MTKFNCTVNGKPMILTSEDAKNLKLMGMEVSVSEIATSAKSSAKPKTQYAPFSLKGSDFTVTSTASKSGNPDAVLHYKSDNKDELRNALLKGFGWKWNPDSKVWYNVNSDEAKKVFTFKAEDIFQK